MSFNSEQANIWKQNLTFDNIDKNFKSFNTNS